MLVLKMTRMKMKEAEVEEEEGTEMGMVVEVQALQLRLDRFQLVGKMIMNLQLILLGLLISLV